MNNRKSWIWAAIVAITCGGLGSGCLADSGAQQNESDPQGDQADGPIADDSEAVTNCSGVTCGNCVTHARCLKPSLPYGLYTCSDKFAIVNSSTPGAGKVAVMNVGSYCHVGYVKSVQGSGTSAVITLDEANYYAGVCGSRSGTAAQLKIVGYFN